MMGERLRILRQRVGLSRADLARLAGVSETAVWRLERGERGGSWELVARLARVLAAEAGRPVGEVLAELVGEEAVQREAAPRRVFLTVREAAYVLGLPLWRVKEAVRRGEMRPRPRPGPRGAVMIPVEEVERYARSLMQEAVHG
uniref:XRE family transcriptional regulator n=1 Tax=Thermus caliditerrae TaxID=1330700 RepID=A0A7C5RE52_9DEIN